VIAHSWRLHLTEGHHAYRLPMLRKKSKQIKPSTCMHSSTQRSPSHLDGIHGRKAAPHMMVGGIARSSCAPARSDPLCRSAAFH
ncbi:unnamed protein product, partial [Ectocarpus fasciculatus]